jgi:hypothetical protein
MSHTVTTKTEFRDKKSLGDAVTRMGGKVLGEGTYHFGGTVNVGFGFHLKDWQYPCVLDSAGVLNFDDYHGAWGNVADLEALKGEYVIEVASAKCLELGWMCQRETSGNLTIFHPSGASIVVERNGTVDALNFHGTACGEAVDAIAGALGAETSRFCKPENALISQEASVQSN